MITIVAATPVTPPPTPAAPDQLGSVIGDGISTLVAGSVDQMMKSIWDACCFVLLQTFALIDWLSKFSVDTKSGPVGLVWPTLFTISALIALGLFFWQILIATLKGGRGLLHAATGTASYGLALGLTVTITASLLGAADGLTELLLMQGQHATNFSGVYLHGPLTQIAIDKIKPVVLGLVGIFGLLPAAFGYAIEMLFRQASILVLVATVPITAAGLLSRSTSRWFWICTRWIMTSIIFKPALALVLVIGLAALNGAPGFMGLLAGIAVLWVALVCPLALFKLLAFIDPATDAGAAFRDTLSNFSSPFEHSFASTGSDATGSEASTRGNNVGGVNDLEQANTTRFDGAASTSGSPSTTPASADANMPPPPPAPDTPPGASRNPTSSTNPGGRVSASGSSPDPGPVSGDQSRTGPDQHPSPVATGHYGASEPPMAHSATANDPASSAVPGPESTENRPTPPHPTHPHSGSHTGTAGVAGEAAEAAETAAVIL